MQRRALLAAVGTLSAGCLGFEPPRTNADPSATSAPSTTSTETPTSEMPPSAEYRLTDLSTATNTEHPSARYVLEPSAYYSADAVEREEERTGESQVVVDIDDVEEDEIRDAIETAVETGEWRSNSLPDGLAETVEKTDFFTGVSTDDTHTHVGLTLHRLQLDQPPAVAFDATVVDDLVEPDSPGVVELAIENTGSTKREVFSGTVPPFSAVFAESTDGDDRFLLWRAYEEEGCINFTDQGMVTCDIGIITELEPGERVARRYEVLPSSTDEQPEYTVPPGPGTYRIADSLSYSEQSGAPSSTLSYEVEFSLEAGD